MKQGRLIFLLSSIIFGVAVMLFFALAYPHHLHFQEQYQLFQFNQNYILGVLSLPGGVADLAGRFLTQFFLYAWVGATLIALVLTGVQYLIYRLLSHSREDIFAQVLSFIPSILYCCFLCDENALMSAPVALLIVLGVALGVSCISSERIRQVIGVVSIPLVYMLAGAFVIPYSLMLIIGEIQRNSSLRNLPAICGMLLLSLLVPVIWHQFAHCSLMQLYVGPHYYRVPEDFPRWAWGAAGVVPLLMLLSKVLSRWNLDKALPVFAASWGVLMLSGGLMVNTLQSQPQENIMAYDFMARNALWNRILQKAQNQAPRNQLAAVALNLALAERDMLTTSMFEFPQNGIAGLLPNFTNDYISPLVTSEAFYRLGMINTAQRFVFEAQEAIPDFQKSARCYKRLAETNLINGSYEVARKYLLALQSTMFYRSWATETLALIEDDKAVEAHPEYGALRKMRIEGEHFFGGNELHQILVWLLEANPKNKIAFEYLEASCMLAKDVEKVTRYYSYSEALGYKEVPSAIQQAMLLHWSQNHSVSDPLPSNVQANILQGFKNFYSTMQAHNGNPAPVKKLYGNTYWSYYYFN